MSITEGVITLVFTVIVLIAAQKLPKWEINRKEGRKNGRTNRNN